MDPNPPQNDHRSMLYHYIHKVSHVEECTYIHGTWTPLQMTIDLCSIITPMKFHTLKGCTYTHGRWMADGRSMLHNYTQ